MGRGRTKEEAEALATGDLRKRKFPLWGGGEMWGNSEILWEL